MKKWFIGLTCIGMLATVAMGALTTPATLPVEWAGETGFTTAAIDAMTGWDATGLGTVYAAPNASTKFDSAGDNIIIYFDGAPGEIVFSARRSSNAALAGPYAATLKESVDNVTYTDVRAFDGSELDGTLVLFTNTLLSSSRYVKFEYVTKPSGQNFGVGYVKITTGGPAVFSVGFDQTSGFEVEENTTDVITATAANGTAPYTYAWTTDLGATYYTAAAAEFTILATAPIGSYSATVVATDAASAKVTNSLNFSVAAPAPAEGIVDFRFNEAPYLQVTAKDSNLAVSDMDLTAGSIEPAVETGDYFPDKPYIEETGGWTATVQADAKAFIFTITPDEGASMTIDAISFNAYASKAGPSAFGFDIGGGTATYAVDAPNSSLVAVSQQVAGVVSETGAIEVKIQGWLNESRVSTGGGIFRLDDVVIHGSVSTGPLEFSVSLDQTSGFTVEEGSSATITATAANGTAPYTYAWTTDLGASYRTINAGVLTILATAPIGSYSATVVATDAASAKVTNSLNFSVAAPAVKYAITIAAAANGTVTTTPATEAAAGATVTVNATANSGYAVGSIVVSGGVGTLPGTTFIMPATPVTVTVTFVEYTAPDALITFEDGTLPSAYTLNTAVLEDGKTWSTMRVVKGNLANDKTIDTLSARLAPLATNDVELALTEPYAEPITKLSFWVASYGTDNMASVVLTVEVSEDAISWTPILTLTGADDITDTMVEHVVESIPADAVYLRFLATSDVTSNNKRVNLDNIGVFFGVPAFGVSFDKANNFVVDEGTEVAITATAANGVVPYGYTWSSDLGAGDYSAPANVFTILDSAPAGSYYAEVVATDADTPAASVTNRINFSVVTPGVVSAITITPPVNGAVTTTPAGEAESGTTVTVNAMPASGFQVGTINVSGIGNIVGTTFTMPASAVTVTVTFSAIPGQPVVVFSGSLNGTVGVPLSLNISITNETASDWGVELCNPDSSSNFGADYSGFPPVWAFTPSVTGTYTLVATALTGSGNYSNTAYLVISEGGGGEEVPIPAITFVAGTGFSFEIPSGSNLVRVEGADTTVTGQEFTWTLLAAPADYEVIGSTVTIKSGAATQRLIRVWFN